MARGAHDSAAGIQSPAVYVSGVAVGLRRLHPPLIVVAWFALAAPALAAVDETAIASCRAERHRNIALARQVCARAAAALEGAGQPLLQFEMLSHLSDAATAAADYATAKRSLDAAAALKLPPDSWEYDYRLLRRRGLLAFRTNDIEAALTWLQSAARLAQRLRQTKFEAISANDVGMVLRRMGDVQGALAVLQQSLQAQRALSKPDLAPILNNIGDLHKDLREWALALQHYREALALYQAAGKTRQVAHTVERLGLIAEAQGDLPAAHAQLEDAFQQFVAMGAWADAHRVRGDQLRLALDAGDLEAARVLAAWRAGPQISGEATLRLALQRARLLRLDGQPAAALMQLDRVLAGVAETDRDRAALLLERAEAVQAQAAAPGEAVLAWRTALAAQRQQYEERYDQAVAGLRVRYELSERERELAAAELARGEAQSALLAARWRLWTGLAVAGAVIVLLGALLLLGRARRRRRSAEAAQVVAESRLRWQQAAQQLDLEQSRSQALLMRLGPPSAVIDSTGRIADCNAEFAALLQTGAGWPAAGVLADLLDPRGVAEWQRALAQVDELNGGRVGLQLQGGGADGAALAATLEPLGPGTPHLLLTVQGDPQRPALETAADDSAQRPEREPDAVPEAAQFWDEPAHREALVAIMLDALSGFERSTGKTRIELAERSRQWRVTVDDGRLRVRAMERYLSLPRLPRMPRWREVLHTAYFVLAECDLQPDERSQLETRTQELQARLRARALLGGVL